MKFVSILMMSILVVSCGKKDSSIEPVTISETSEALAAKKEFLAQKVIDDENCIDEVLFKELTNGDRVKKVLEQSDINFCNGLRLRIKVFKISNGETRVYGFAESNTGKKSCLKQGTDYSRTPFLGDQGTLVGDKIKISLGGHEYSNDGKLMKSDHLRGKHVKFDVASYKGEMGFFENDKLKCWAMH